MKTNLTPIILLIFVLSWKFIRFNIFFNDVSDKKSIFGINGLSF